MRKTLFAIVAVLLSLRNLTDGGTDDRSTPHIAVQGADFYRFQAGAVVLTALSEGTVPQDLHALLSSMARAKTDALLDASFLSTQVCLNRMFGLSRVVGAAS
jgi:hypothetical protein